MTTQDQVRDWWSRNPMSYDVDDPIPYEEGSQEFFREIDRRIFHPRYMRLTADASGKPFSLFVDFDSLRGKAVLDVGIGSGIATQMLAEAGANVTGVDLTDWAVETTRRRLAAFALEADVRQADAERLPFADASFDLVFSWGVIHHSSDMDRALAELVRVTRPGGQVVLMVYHRRSLFFLVYRGFQRFLPLARRLGLHFEGARVGETHGLIARHFTIEELRRKLVGAGLRDVWIKPYGQDAELLPLPRRIRLPLTERIPRAVKDPILRRLGHQLGVRATKPLVPRLLLVTPAELTRDPRARRAAIAAKALGFGVVGLTGRISGEEPAPLEGVQIVRTGPKGRTNAQWKTGDSHRREPAPLRELRGLYRVARLGLRTRGLRRAGRTIGRTDVVHANDLETLPAAYLLAKELHSRLVYDAHEIYAEFDPNPPRIARAVLARIERRLARRADAVVTVSEPVAEELRRRLGVEPIVVLNATELDDREPPEPAKGALRAIYQGAFGTGRPLDDLLEAVRRAPSVHLTLRVNRSTREALERVLPADLRERVSVEDPVPPSEVVTALHGHHVGLLFDRPLTRNAELSAPNKLFEYLMAGLAVVAPDLSGLHWLAEEELGVLFDAGSPESFGLALESLAADPARVAQLRENARRAALERYNAEAQRAALSQAWGDTAARA